MMISSSVSLDEESTPSLSFRRPLAVIDGQPVNVSGMEETLIRVVERLAHSRSFLVCTLNLDHLVKRRSSKEFRDAYRKAEIVTVDGFPVAALARLSGAAISRATGADLILPLCREAASRNLQVFLVGSTLPALSATSRHLIKLLPNLQICGVYAPPAGFDVHSEIADEAISVIRQSGARICFVALGAPRQEIFAARAIDLTNQIGFLAIGGGLDFLAGSQMRCPTFIRRLYLEWAWRLMLNPRRLGLRYFRCAVLLIVLLARASVTIGRAKTQSGVEP